LEFAELDDFGSSNFLSVSLLADWHLLGLFYPPDNGFGISNWVL